MYRPPLQLPEYLQPIFIEDQHPSCIDEEALLAACTMSRGKTRGPGGQHRNKVQTMVEYVHKATGITGAAGERRSPAENARVALRRLRLSLAWRVRSWPSEPTPTALWQSRCRKGRIACNPSHNDYPAMLAEALDHVFNESLDQRKAALRLDCSASQLIRLVADHAPALQWWNAARTHKGMRPLRP